jgi:hypothetical protein
MVTIHYSTGKTTCEHSLSYLLKKQEFLKHIPTGWEINTFIIKHVHSHSRSSCEYDDGIVKITILKRITWKLDDCDMFTKIDVWVKGKNVYSEDN